MRLARQLAEAIADLQAGDFVRYREKAGWRTLKDGERDWTVGVLRARHGGLWFHRIMRAGSKVTIESSGIEVTPDVAKLMAKISKEEAVRDAERPYLRVGGLLGMLR